MNLIDQKINLKYLQTEKSIEIKDKSLEVKEIIEVKQQLLSGISSRLNKLGLSQESFWIKADNQEAWDRFIAWQKINCEYIILITAETGLGTHIGLNVIYKNKQ